MDPVLRRSTTIRVSLIVIPFLAIIVAARMLSPLIRDARIRSDLASVDDFIREDLAGVTVYRAAAVDPETARGLGVALAAFASELVEEWGEFFLLRPVPPPVVLEVFASSEQLATFHSEQYRETFHNLGGFYDSRSRLVAVPAPVFALESLRTLFHEGTHLVFDLSHSGSVGRFPIWLNEGLATYFEVTDLGGGGVLELGGVDRSAMRMLAEALDSGRIRSADQVLRSGPAEFRGERNGDYYSAAHGLVAYLMEGEGGALRRGFGSYYRELRSGRAVNPGLIYWKVDSDAESFDRGWRRFVSESVR